MSAEHPLTGADRAVPSLALSLDSLAAHYGALGDALASLHVALTGGDMLEIAAASRTVSEITLQTTTAYDAIMPDGLMSTPLIERIQTATDTSTDPRERDRLVSGAALVAERMARVMTLREQLGSLADDLVDANGQMLDVVRQLDGRGTTYDRQSSQRSGNRSQSLVLLDTSV